MNLNREIQLDRFLISILVFIMLSVNVFAQPLSGVKTIGATGNYATFSAAVSALSTNGVSGPVVFNVQAGTYTEQIAITAITGASATNTITFQSATLDSTDVVLSLASQTSSFNNHLVYLNGADYITFRKMSFERSGTNANARFFLMENGATNTTFSNCVFTGIPTTTNSYAMSFIFSDDDNDHNTKVVNNKFINGAYGVRFKGLSTTSREQGTEVIGNSFINQYVCPIILHFQTAPVVLNNEILSNSVYNSFYGINIINCDEGTQVVANKIIAPNATLSRGISLSFCDASVSDSGLVANNFVYGRATALDDYGIQISHCEYQRIYNNSVNVYGSAGCAFYIASGSNNLVINNVFAHTDGYAANFETSFTVSAVDYNNYYTTGSNFVKNVYIDKANLAQLKLGSTRNVHSISSDPQFLSATDLHSNSVSMNNMGVSLFPIIHDIDGELRSTTTPDIGADEYTPVLGLVVTANNNVVCNGDSVTLNVTSTGAVGNVSYLWVSNPSGLTSNIPNPKFQINADTWFYVSVTDSLLSAVDSILITSNALPAVIVTSDIAVCTGDSALVNIAFTGASPWDFVLEVNSIPSAITETGATSPFTTYIAPATNTKFVLTSLTDANGCISTGRLDSLMITVNQTPVATASATINPVNVGLSTTLNGSATGGSGGYDYIWTPAASIAGSNTLQNVSTIAMTISTAFVLTVTDTVSNCQATDNLTLNVTGSALSVSATANDSSICVSESVSLNALVTGGGANKTYSWTSSPSGFTSSIANPTAVVTADTWYIVTVNDGTNTDIDSVHVSAFALSTATSVLATAAVCDGDSIQLSVNLTGATPYTLYVSDGTPITIPNISTTTWSIWVIPTATTTYSVDSIMDSNGCLSVTTANTIVTLNPLPNVTFSGLNAADCANGAPSILIGSPTGGTFSGLGVTSSTFDPTVVGVASSTVFYLYTDANMCSNTDSQTVVVNSFPVFNLGNDTTLKMSWSSITLDPGTFASYLWQDQTKNQTYVIDPNTLAAGTYTYSVIVTDANSCNGADSIEITILRDVGFDNPTDNTFISLYPNPNNGLFHLEITDVVGPVEIHVFDSQGKLILKEQLMDDGGQISTSLNMENQTKGVYQIRILTEKGLYLERVIIQ